MSDDHEPDHAVRRFFGAGLMAVGIVMMVLCGACTALVAVFIVPAGISSLITMISGQGAGSFILLWLATGVLPTAVGFGVFRVGKRLRNTSRPNPPQTDTPPPLP
jgi:hypothetical protein